MPPWVLYFSCPAELERFLLALDAVWKSTYQVGWLCGGAAWLCRRGGPSGGWWPRLPPPHGSFCPAVSAGGPSAQAPRGQLRQEEMRGRAEPDPQHVAAQRQPVSWPGFPGPLVLASQEAKNGLIPLGGSTRLGRGKDLRREGCGPRLLWTLREPSLKPGWVCLLPLLLTLSRAPFGADGYTTDVCAKGELSVLHLGRDRGYKREWGSRSTGPFPGGGRVQEMEEKPGRTMRVRVPVRRVFCRIWSY